MKYIFEIVWIGWFVSEVLLSRLFRSGTNKSESLDKNSMGYIWITIFASITAGVICLFYLNFPITASNSIRYIGLVLILLGIIIRYFAISTLGKFFTVDLAIHKEHTLINKGLYKYVRHPSYTGLLLSFFGLGLSLNNWTSLALIFVPISVVMIYRINIEEKLLLGQMGKDYSEYMKCTKRLISLIY